MGYIIPAGYSRVNLEYLPGSPMGSKIVTGFGVNSDPGDLLLDTVRDWWNESLKLRTSVHYTLTRIEARNDVAVLDRTIGTTGTLAGDSAPPNTAALVKMTTGLVGRKYRGRMYLPGVLLDSDVTDGGTLPGPTQVSLQGTMSYLYDLLETIDVQLVILHSDVGTPTLVTGGGVESTVATQRRRLRR